MRVRVLLPSAATVSTVCVCLSPSVLIVRVWLLGGGPGSNFDLATLSCQVPSHALSAYASDPQASNINARTARVANLLCRDSMILLLVAWCALLYSPRCSRGKGATQQVLIGPRGVESTRRPSALSCANGLPHALPLRPTRRSTHLHGTGWPRCLLLPRLSGVCSISWQLGADP